MAAKTGAPSTPGDVKFRGKVLTKPAIRPGMILWPLFLVIGASLLGYGVWLWYKAEQAGGFTARSPLGIGLALVSMAFAFVAMLYPLRKRTYLLPIGQLEPWCIVHVFTGLVSFAFILVHADFGLGAWVSAALMLTFGAIVLSGIYGYFVVNERNPKILNRLEIGEDGKQSVRLLEDLSDGIEATEKEIEDLVKSGGAAIQSFVDPVKKKANSLSTRSALFSSGYTFKGHTDKLRASVAQWTEKLPPKESAELERIALAQARLNNLKLQFQLQFQLRAWLSFHIVATALMLTLLFWHVLTAVFYF
jgi:hypothetical protein